MNRRHVGEAVFRALTRAYPRAFRRTYQHDLMVFFREERDRPRQPGGVRGWLAFWIRTIRDLLRASAAIRAESSVSEYTRLAAAPDAGHRDSIWRRSLTEVRTARRSLLSTPGLTTLAVVVLTIGIGVSTTIFAVADAIALRGLPFDRAGELVAISETELPSGRPVTVAPQNYLEWQDTQTVFRELGASNYLNLVLREGDQAERLLTARVSPSLFHTLRANPAKGRLFTADDAMPGRDAVMLISDTFWRTRLGADPNAIGRKVAFEDRTRQIVGIMPPEFEYPLGTRLATSVGVWLPLTFPDDSRARDGGRTYSLTVIGRLKAGVSREMALDQMRAIRNRLAADHPRWFEDRGVDVLPLESFIVPEQTRSWTALMLGAVGLVLLIACANVANLLLTRVSGRAREFGIRVTLGASRRDLLRSVVVEGLLLAAVSVAGGWLLAHAGVGVLRATLPDGLARLSMIVLDTRVFLVAAGAAVATAVIASLAPAVGLRRMDISGRLRESGRTNAGGRTHQRLGAALVIAEVSVAIVLLVGTGLFVASFLRILQRDLGFDPAHAVSLSVSPPGGPIALGRTPEEGDAALRLRLAGILAALEASPDVEAAAILNGGVPLSGSSRRNAVLIDGRTEPFTGLDEVYIREVTSGYLEALRLRLRKGRWITPGDVSGAPLVAVINEEAAERYFPGRDPIGQRITFDEVARQVVGVVGRTRFRGPESEPPPEVFVPLAQADVVGGQFVVRVRGDAATALPALKSIVWRAAPDMTVANARTLDDMFRTLLAQRRFNMLLVSVFGVVALLLVFAGIFGVMAHNVSQRVREIGVRMALGARPSSVLRMVLARAGALAACGLALGGLASAALERFARAFLFRPPDHDVAVYGAVAVLLMGTTLMAALLPARRAARIDPLESLRRD